MKSARCGWSRRFCIAVLPFTSLTDDGRPDPLADALVNNLTTDLAISFPASTVIASASAFTYRGTTIDPRVVGREIGARYLLEGSVQRTSDSTRVNVHLVEAASAAQLWSDHFERSIADITGLQDEITTGIANARAVQIVRVEADRQKVVSNPIALDLIFRASSSIGSDYTDDRSGAAEALLRQAMAIAPDDLMAPQSLGGLLLARAGVHVFHQDDKFWADLEEAQKLVDRVRTRDSRRPGLNDLLAFNALLTDKPQEALDSYAKEISVDSSAASAYAGQGLCLIKFGRAAEAIPLIQKSIRLDPRNPAIAGNYQALMLAYFAGRLPARHRAGLSRPRRKPRQRRFPLLSRRGSRAGRRRCSGQGKPCRSDETGSRSPSRYVASQRDRE